MPTRREDEFTTIGESSPGGRSSERGSFNECGRELRAAWRSLARSNIGMEARVSGGDTAAVERTAEGKSGPTEFFGEPGNWTRMDAQRWTQRLLEVEVSSLPGWPMSERKVSVDGVPGYPNGELRDRAPGPDGQRSSRVGDFDLAPRRGLLRDADLDAHSKR